MPDDTHHARSNSQADRIGGRPTDAAFAVTPIDRTRTARRHVMAVVIVAILIVAINLLPASERADERPTPTIAAVPSSPPTTRPTAEVARRLHADPVHHVIGWSAGMFEVDVPDGWSWSTDDLLTLAAGGLRGPDIRVSFDQDVAAVRTRLCVSADDFVEAGQTVDDLLMALRQQTGASRRLDPNAFIGGHRSWRFTLTLPSPCPEPAEGITLWQRSDGSEYTPLEAAVVTIDVMDVDGHRMVITTDQRGVTPEQLEARDRIYESLRITSGDDIFPWFDPQAGRQLRWVDGIELSAQGPGPGWESHGPYLSKSVVGPQAAEAAILLTTNRDDARAAPCSALLGSLGPSADDLGAALASAPGVGVIRGPTDDTVGGLRAVRLTVEVTELVAEACQPWLFFSSPISQGGAFWSGTDVGDSITVWVVEVGGGNLVIETLAHPDIDQLARVEIRSFVDSLAFEGEVARPTPVGRDVASYLQDLRAICAAATDRWLREDDGSDAVPSSLPAMADELETTTRLADDAIAALRAVPIPDAWREEAILQLDLIEWSVEPLRALPTAARAGDETRVQRLLAERIDRTHRKDDVVDPSLWGCPLALPA